MTEDDKRDERRFLTVVGVCLAIAGVIFAAMLASFPGGPGEGLRAPLDAGVERGHEHEGKSTWNK